MARARDPTSLTMIDGHVLLRASPRRTHDSCTNCIIVFLHIKVTFLGYISNECHSYLRGGSERTPRLRPRYEVVMAMGGTLLQTTYHR